MKIKRIVISIVWIKTKLSIFWKNRVFGVYLPLLFLVRTCLCVSNHGRKRTRASGGVSVNDRSGDGHSDSEAREDLAEV